MLRQLIKTFTPSSDNSDSVHNDTERKLQFSELRYRRLFETAQDGILILDAQTGKITDANPFLKEILGYSLPELLGKELWEIGVFKDIKESKAAFLQLQKKGYIRYKDLPLETKDGRSIDVEFVSNVYMVGSEKVIQCNIRDITDRRRAEEEVLRRSKELEIVNKSQEETKVAMLNVMEDLEAARSVIEIEKVKDEAILASIGEGLIAVDTEKKIIIINKAAEFLLGWSMKELIGRKITGLRLEDEKGDAVPLKIRPVLIALATGKVTNSTYFYVRKDKERIPVAINVTPIQLGKKTVGAVIIFRDITREREIDRAKSEFVSLASHQLRTPLGIVKWYIEALEQDIYYKKAPVSMRNYVDEISKSNERVLSLVRDLLSVSRIDQGTVKNNPKPSNLIEQVKETVSQMQILAHKKKVLLNLSIPDEKIPLVNIDILRFHEVMENLISNAIDYTVANDKILVSIYKAAGRLIIRIKDTGMGISEADQKRLFSKFFRSEKAIGHNPEGSGLGLYVAKSYIEGWGGEISATSVEGKGSTFTIHLPINQKHEKVPALREATPNDNFKAALTKKNGRFARQL